MWAKIKSVLVTGWKTHSVVFFRIHTFLGVVFSVLIATDMSAFIKDQKLLTAWMLFCGVAGETSRRFKSDDVE